MSWGRWGRRAGGVEVLEARGRGTEAGGTSEAGEAVNEGLMAAEGGTASDAGKGMVAVDVQAPATAAESGATQGGKRGAEAELEGGRSGTAGTESVGGEHQHQRHVGVGGGTGARGRWWQRQSPDGRGPQRGGRERRGGAHKAREWELAIMSREATVFAAATTKGSEAGKAKGARRPVRRCESKSARARSYARTRPRGLPSRGRAARIF